MKCPCSKVCLRIHVRCTLVKYGIDVAIAIDSGFLYGDFVPAIGMG